MVLFKHPFLNSTEFKNLFKNFSNFTVFQITNALIPFLALPYIVRIIGVEKFGILSIASAVTFYLQLIAEYGFSISGIQQLAANINNKSKISEIYCTTTFIKIITSVLLFLLLCVILFVLQFPFINSLVFIYTYLSIPATILQAVWFFNGVEKIQYLNYTNLISRLLYIFSIFIFIKVDSDFYLVPLINSITMSIGGFVSTYFIITRFRLKFTLPGINIIKKYLAEDWPIFISNVGMNLYRNTNVFILGLLASTEVVGLYAAGERVVRMVQTVFIPVTNVFYPFFSRHKEINLKKSLRMFRMVLLMVGTASLVLSIFIVFFAENIIDFIFGSLFTKSVYLLRISTIVIFTGLMNNMIGFIFMINFSLKDELKKSTILTGIVNVVLCFILSYYYMETGAAITFAFAETFLMITLIYYVYTRKQFWLNWK